MYLNLKEKLFWNTFIRYVIQSTMKLQMAAGTVIVLTIDVYSDPFKEETDEGE